LFCFSSLLSCNPPCFCPLPSLSNDVNGAFRTSNGSISEYLDIWLLGSILYEARKFQAFLFSLPQSGSMLTYFLDNGKKALPYPSMTNIQDELLVSALKEMLHKDPHRRSSAASLLLHPYFSKEFLVYSGFAYKELIEVYKNIADFKFQGPSARAPLLLEISSMEPVEHLLLHYSNFTAADLVREITLVSAEPEKQPELASYPTKVHANLVAAFWKSLEYKDTYFEAFLYNKTAYLLPSKKVKDLENFRLLGLVIFKALFDKTTIPSSIAVLVTNTIHWGRTGLLDNPNKMDPEITEFDRLVVGAYTAQLRALRTGLIALDIFSKVSRSELLVHACGPQELTNRDILSCVQFYDFHPSSPTPGLLKDYIESLQQKSLMKFLIFVSSQSTLQCLMPVAGPDGSLQYDQRKLEIKFIRKKGASMMRDIERVGCGSIEIFEFDDADDLIKAFNLALI